MITSIAEGGKVASFKDLHDLISSYGLQTEVAFYLVLLSSFILFFIKGIITHKDFSVKFEFRRKFRKLRIWYFKIFTLTMFPKRYKHGRLLSLIFTFFYFYSGFFTFFFILDVLSLIIKDTPLTIGRLVGRLIRCGDADEDFESDEASDE